MNLSEIRKEIDKIDAELLALFIKRMEVCEDVARFKKENNLPILQSGREGEIISKVREASPDRMKDGAEQLFKTIMSVSRELQKPIIEDENA